MKTFRPRAQGIRTVAEFVLPDGRRWKVRVGCHSISGKAWFLASWTTLLDRKHKRSGHGTAHP